MNRQIRQVAFLVAAWLVAGSISGCAMLETKDVEFDRAAPEQYGCRDVLAQLDEGICQAGVSDIQAKPIPGFPNYRVNRFLASFAGELSDDKAREEWVAHLARLGNEARRVELANLPKQSFPDLPGEFTGKDLPVKMEQCVAQLMDEDLRNPDRINLLEESAIAPDDYSTLMRVVGLYPISSWFVMRGVFRLQDGLRRDFQRPEAMDRGTIQWYVPDRPRPEISPEKRAGILKQARKKSALDVPEPDPEALSLLFDYYAPVWRISTEDDSDHVGRPFWKDEYTLALDINDPVVYRHHSFTRVGNHKLLQLNYLIWFSRRPSQSFFDYVSGHLDGLIWRVTLDHEGRVLLYDSVHPCGCFHSYYPVSTHLHPLDEPPTDEPPLIFTQDIPDSEDGRVVIHLTSREHHVVGLSTENEKIREAARYRFDEYATLRNLPYGDGHRSMFEPDGLVPGTQRAEHWLVWPMGVNSAGAMRQWGNHATSLVGRQHFDDARLLENVFEFKDEK